MLLHAEEVSLEPVVTDSEDVMFYFIEERADFALFFVGTPHALGAGHDDLAKDVFVANDFEVVINIRCRRHKREQARHKRCAADRFEDILITQCLGKGDEVDRLADAPLLHQNAKYRLVSGNVKILLFDFLDAFRDNLLRRDQH